MQIYVKLSTDSQEASMAVATARQVACMCLTNSINPHGPHTNLQALWLLFLSHFELAVMSAGQECYVALTIQPAYTSLHYKSHIIEKKCF